MYTRLSPLHSDCASPKQTKLFLLYELTDAHDLASLAVIDRGHRERLSHPQYIGSFALLAPLAWMAVALSGYKLAISKWYGEHVLLRHTGATLLKHLTIRAYLIIISHSVSSSIFTPVPWCACCWHISTSVAPLILWICLIHSDTSSAHVIHLPMLWIISPEYSRDLDLQSPAMNIFLDYAL